MNQVELEIRDRGLFINEKAYLMNGVRTGVLDSTPVVWNEDEDEDLIYEIQEFTLSTFVKFTGTNGMFFALGALNSDLNSTSGGIYFRKVGSNIRIKGRFKQTQTLDTSLDTTVTVGWTTGTWLHVFITKNENIFQVYIDNVLAATVDAGIGNKTIRFETIQIPTPGRQTLMGGLPTALINPIIDPLTMRTDETAFFDFALNPSERATVYNAGRPSDLNELYFLSNERKLLAWFRMGDNATYDSGLNKWTFPNESFQNSQPAFSRIFNAFVSPSISDEVKDADVTQVSDNVLGVIDLEDHESFPLALTYSTSNISNINTRSGTFSKLFKVPATHLTNETLKYLHNINAEDIDSVKAERRAILRVNGVQLPGFLIRLKKIIYEGDIVIEYEFLLIGNNLDWVTRLKRLALNQIDLGSVVFDVNEVSTSWSDVNPDRLIVFPLINYGALIVQGQVSVEDLRPAIFLREWLRLMFDRIGYTIDSEFFEGTFTPNGHDFRNFIYPIVAKGAFNSESYARRFDFKGELNNPTLAYRNFGSVRLFIFGPLGSPDVTALIETDTGGYVDIGGFPESNNWIPNQIGRVRHTCSLSSTRWFVNPGASLNSGQTQFEIEVLFKVKHIDGITAQVSIIASQTVVFISSNSGSYSQTEDIELDTGFYTHTKDSQITIEAELITANAGNLFLNTTPAGGLFIGGGTWEVEGSREFAVGQTIRPNEYLSESVSQFDLVNGLTGLFNLHFDTDTELKRLTIEPRDNFYKPISEAIDWTDKLDLTTKPIVSILSDYKRQLTFEYLDDEEDGYVTEFERIYSENIGAYLHTLSNRFQPGGSTIGTKYFAYTSAMQLKGAYYSNILGVDKDPFLVARMWHDYDAEADENLSYPTAHHIFNPRILDWKGLTSQGGTKNWRFESFFQFTAPIALAVDTETGEGANLDYRSVVIEGTTHEGLFETYFSSTVAIIEKGTVLNAKFYLTEVDIQTLDLRVPIFIRHPELYGYYVIDTIKDYKPHKVQSSPVILVRHESLEPVVTEATGITQQGQGLDTVAVLGGVDDETDLSNPTGGGYLGIGTGIDQTYNPNIGTGGGGTTTTDQEGIRFTGAGIDPKEEGARDRFEAIDTEVNGSQTRPGEKTARYNPSMIMRNGSNNQAQRNSGSVVLGRGLISNQRNQTILGRFNNPNSRDLFQYGVGVGEDCRETALSVTEDGLVRTYGGEVFMQDEDGKILDVIMEDSKTGSYSKVFRSSYGEGEEIL